MSSMLRELVGLSGRANKLGGLLLDTETYVVLVYMSTCKNCVRLMQLCLPLASAVGSAHRGSPSAPSIL